MSSEASSTAPPSARGGADEPTQRDDASGDARDPELGAIFCEMRRAVQLTQEQLADQLLTNVATVAALEQGAVLDLPDVAETSRIVATYANLLGLDARPILRRIEARRRPPAPREPESAPPAPESELFGGPPQPSPSHGMADAEAGHEIPDLAADPDLTAHYVEPTPPLRRIGARRIVSWLMLLALSAGLAYGVWFMAQRPKLVWSAVDSMPGPISRLTRNAWEFVKPLDKETTPGRSPDDPRSRKADKLPVGGASPAN